MSTPRASQVPDENTEYELVITEFVARTVTRFPPFTPEQRARLAVLLRVDNGVKDDGESGDQFEADQFGAEEAVA